MSVKPRWKENGKLRSRMFLEQKQRCCYCNRIMRKPRISEKQDRPNTATIEHLQRRSEGGSNKMGNKRIACFECNNGRGDTNWLEWKTIRMGETQELEAIQ